MYLNIFADSATPLDMTGTDEFASLLASAADLAIPHASTVRYTSANIVLRQHRFHLLEWGEADAPSILLLHGGHQSAHSWDLVSLSLARRFRVLALDQRGHGDSEWARDATYSNHEMALDAAALITATGLRAPVVIGHSMGGRNAMLLAREDRRLMRALVVVDVGPELSAAGREAIAGFVRANQEFDDLEQFVENVRRYDPYRTRAHIERTVKYNMLRRADGRFVSKCDATPRRLGLPRGTDPRDQLTLGDMRALDLPVLIVRGERSNVLDPEAALRFRDALPRGRLVTVPNAGHGVPSQNTAGFLGVLEAFLDAL